MVHSRLLLGLLGLCLALPDDCEEGECALSFRQLRGQKFESDISEHEGLAMDEDKPVKVVETMTASPETAPGAEETADTFSKPEANATEEAKTEAPVVPETTQGSEGTEDNFSKPSDVNATIETKTEAPETAPGSETTADNFSKPVDASNTTETTETVDTKPTPEPAPAVPNETHIKLQAEWEDKVGGVCCYSGASVDDICGTCFPAAIADFESKCAAGRWKCDSCGGAWCEPKCVISAQDPKNMCNTAFDSGIAESNSTCGKSHAGCSACGGEWCRTGVKKIAGGAGSVNENNGAASSENAVATGGFCCYRGDTFAKDMCTACLDVSQDINCASKSKCGTCGGNWCAGPRCVTAYSDKADPCHSAYGPSSVAHVNNYCSSSENTCINCGGAPRLKVDSSKAPLVPAFS
ncbi:ycf1-A [Symbiodinium sp. CCMP2592]|nr:ycf1-A [Symbiodinium sp. CCMP2592]